MIIHGWMREDERLALRRWSFGRNVLEMGCFEGLSTINIAATAYRVTSVDSFDGRGTPEIPVRERFEANLQEAGVREKVQVIPGVFSEVLPGLPGGYDLALIDGSHDYESVSEDIRLSRDLLVRGSGLLAFHDYDIDHPGVTRAVRELIDGGASLVDQSNSLVLIDLWNNCRQNKPPHIAVVCPTSDGWALRESVVASIYCSNKYTRSIFSRSSSLLPTNHNQLLCDALNERINGVTHLAMLHNDIAPCHGWVDILLEEMSANHLDVISAVVPLKNGKGLTSTGVGSPGSQYAVRRVSLKELFDLQETFTVNDLPYRQDEDCGLLVNTGCFLMKLDQPWVDGLHFRQHDRLVFELKTGLHKAQAISEDWDFSRQLFYRGARIGATRKVPLYHGTPECHNRSVWGTEAEDQDYLRGDRLAKEGPK